MTEKERAPEIDFHFADGIFVKHIVIEKPGYMVPQHAHELDHVSFLATGSVRAWRDGKLLGEYHAPAGIFIEAGAKHAFLTLAPNTTLLCIHNLGSEKSVRVLAEHELTAADVAELLRPVIGA